VRIDQLTQVLSNELKSTCVSCGHPDRLMLNTIAKEQLMTL